jgi:hypothetical protein
MIEFRNKHHSVKLTINTPVNRKENIDMDMMEIIVNICGVNEYKWRVTDKAYKFAPIINYDLFRRNK